MKLFVLRGRGLSTHAPPLDPSTHITGSTKGRFLPINRKMWLFQWIIFLANSKSWSIVFVCDHGRSSALTLMRQANNKVHTKLHYFDNSSAQLLYIKLTNSPNSGPPVVAGARPRTRKKLNFQVEKRAARSRQLCRALNRTDTNRLKLTSALFSCIIPPRGGH